jgi:hypothetical protein
MMRCLNRFVCVVMCLFRRSKMLVFMNTCHLRYPYWYRMVMVFTFMQAQSLEDSAKCKKTIAGTKNTPKYKCNCLIVLNNLFSLARRFNLQNKLQLVHILFAIHDLIDQFPVQFRRHQFNKCIHITTKISPLL